MKRWVGLLLILSSLYFVFLNLNEKKNNKNVKEKEKNSNRYEYGICVDTLNVLKGLVKPGQTLGEILYANHINHSEIAEIVDKSKNIFDVRRVKPGSEYTVICKKDSIDKAVYFIYQENIIDYVVFDLVGEIDIYKGKKEVTTKLKKSQGKIIYSLSESIDSLKVSPRVSIQLSEIYAWTIDFFKIQKGDEFNVYYENNYVEGNYIGIGKILASEFTHKNKKFYAFYYQENENYGEYFDEKGRSLRKAFLKAPLNFYRISSRYSKNRRHPVTGQWKGHFGTDYAAPKGTPIMTTANGTISAVGYTKNNGNFVKVRHNGTYTTQYLHMSKIKPGLKKGIYVEQGEIIGFVGSTGLATGQHVCYRFWKNGKQVDPYKENLPPGDPIKKENEEGYSILKDSLMQILEKR